MQKFKFFMEYLRVTERELDTYSHSGSLAMDFGGKDTGSDKLYCPCDMIVKRARQNANGELYLESVEPVEFADGTTDYARLLCVHDGVFNVSEGQIIAQGEYFYDEGGMYKNNPSRYGNHVHTEAGKGKWKSCTQSPNANGVYVIENQAHLYDLFILGDDVQILDGGGYNWKRVSDIDGATLPNTEDDTTIYGVDISHNQPATASKDILAGGKAQFAILRTAVGSSQIDYNFIAFLNDFKGKLKLGFYPINYFNSVEDAKAEADFTIDVLQENGITQPDLPIFCDWEGLSYEWNAERGRIVTPSELREYVEAFCEQIKARGYAAGIYCNKHFYDNWYGQAFFDEHPDYWVWLSDPSYDAPQRPCKIHQYASNIGTEYGYDRNLDKNRLLADYLTYDVSQPEPAPEKPSENTDTGKLPENIFQLIIKLILNFLKGTKHE